MRLHFARAASLVLLLALEPVSVLAQSSTVPAKLPDFHVYRNKPDDEVVVIVPVNSTTDQMKALLWYFRQRIRTGDFQSLGITKPTSKHYGKFDNKDGTIVVYRGSRCADEGYRESVGPCGRGEHHDALYQWGIDGDPAKDYGELHLKNGDFVTVFEYHDGWHPKS